MDAEYLRSTLADVVAKGCAATIAIAPADPIEYLSLWLLKHVENEEISMGLLKEREESKQAQMMKQDEFFKQIAQKGEHKKKQAEAIDQLRSIKEDPYLLWDTCLKAIITFTGSSSAYIALLTDRLWEPPYKKKGNEQGEAAEIDEAELDTEEEKKQDEEQEGVNAEPDKEFEGGSGDSQTVVLKKKEKSPNYNRKILLYVAATPDNSFMINKQMDKKLGPVTFKAILQGHTQLHVPNVLYQEGVHFFQGIPLVGAYFVVPVVLNTTPIQITAVLCADTLRKEGFGSGRPFSMEEQRFFVSASQAIGDVMTEISKCSTNTADTEETMKILRDRIQQINAFDGDGLNKLKSASGQDSQSKNEGLTEQKEDGDKSQGTTEQASPNDTKANVDLVEDNDEPITDATGEENEGSEDVEEEDQKEDEKIESKKQRQIVIKLEKRLKKYNLDLEKRSSRVSKLQKQLEQSGKAMQHFQAHLFAVVDVIDKFKDRELLRVKQWPLPPMCVYRMLKAVLCVLGYSMVVIDDWTKARKVFDDNFCTVLRNYDPLKQDSGCWDFCEICLEGITEEMISTGAAIGYLAQQWVLAARDMTTASVKHQKLKFMYEIEAKSFADLELEKLIAEIDLRAAVNEDATYSRTLEENKGTSASG